MVTFLPVVACVLYRGLQFGALGPLGIVHVAYYCTTQARSFSEMCVYARRSVSCYKEHKVDFVVLTKALFVLMQTHSTSVYVCQGTHLNASAMETAAPTVFLV